MAGDPGLLPHRRSIAKDVLGTDDPTEVQAALKAVWISSTMAERPLPRGYKMLLRLR